MRILAGLILTILGAGSVQAQVADAWVSVVTVQVPAKGGAGSVIADARCFSSRGPVMGAACSGDLVWSLERCQEGPGCIPRRFRTTALPHRIVVTPDRLGLYRLRVWAPDLGMMGEATFRRGPLDR